MALVDDKLYKALVTSDDVNLVILDYEQMRQRMGEKKSISLPSNNIVTPLQVFQSKRRATSPAASESSSTSSSTSSSSASSNDSQRPLKRPPSKVAYKKIVVRSKVSAPPPPSKNFKNVPPPTSANVPSTAAAANPRKWETHPDGFDESVIHRSPHATHVPTRSRSAQSVSVSQPSVVPQQVVIPTGVPVIGTQEFRKMLTEGQRSSSRGDNNPTDVAQTSRRRSTFLAPPPPEYFESPPRHRSSSPVTRVVPQELTQRSIQRDRTSPPRGIDDTMVPSIGGPPKRILMSPSSAVLDPKVKANCFCC